MGYIKRECLIILGGPEEPRQALINFVKSVPGMRKHIAISKIVVNFDFTAILWPDGSKEGWPTSDKVNEYRTKLKDWIAGRPKSEGWEYYHFVLTDEYEDGDFIFAPRLEEEFNGSKRNLSLLKFSIPLNSDIYKFLGETVSIVELSKRTLYLEEAIRIYLNKMEK